MQKVALVACSKTKRQEPNMPAKRLYTSPLFKKSLRLACLTHADVLILSAKHGILDTGDLIDPYDRTLRKMDHAEHCLWAHLVDEQLRSRYSPEHSLLHADVEFTVFGGEAYWCLLRTSMKAKCAWPDGLGGIGGVMHWLDEQIQRWEEAPIARGPRAE